MIVPGGTILSNPNGLLDLDEAEVYRCLIGHLESGTSFFRAVLRCARESGVTRNEVMAIIRKANPEWGK